MRLVPTFCGKDCGGNACPLMAEVDAGRVVRVTDNPAGGRYLKGCRRGYRMPLELYAPDRLLKPLIGDGERGSGRFREASWDEALAMTASRLGEVRSRYGARAVLNLGSAGATSALHNTGGLLGRFLSLFGGATRLTGSYSSGAANFVLPYLLGEDAGRSGFDAATMRYSQMIVLWGANVLEARLGTEIDQRLLEAARRGARIVVIDPRRSQTAIRTDAWWIPIRPATDAALMLAVLHVLLAENRVDRAFAISHSVGFEELERSVMGGDGGEARTPEWAERVCGVPKEEIVRFARAYGSAKPAMLLPGFSIQRVFAGEDSYRLSIALQIATGNFGVRGGSTGSINNRLPSPRVGRLPVPGVRYQPTVAVVRWPDAVLEGSAGGYGGDLRAIYSVGGNFLNQGGDVRKNVSAFLKVDFSVCHDLFMTPTARYSDVILPTAHALEKEDIGAPWLGNFLTYRQAAVPIRGAARTDYDILCDLSDRLGFGPEFSEGRSAQDWLQRFLDQSEVTDHDAFRATGLYLGRDQERVGLADFAADPSGHPLQTPSGKVEIASSRYHRDTGFPVIPTWQPQPADPRHPLRLITPKSPHRTHSQGSGIEEIRRLAAHALEMNAGDAAARGIADGEVVRAFDDRGEVRLTVRLSQDIAPGVVSIPEGMWVNLDAAGWDTAGSANMLTSTQGTAPAVACIMHGVAVEVSRIDTLEGA